MVGTMRSTFRFPDPVNEVSARLVAGGVVLLALATLVTASPWLLAVLAYGFVARVLTGPTLSPLGQFVTRVVTPRLPVEPRSSEVSIRKTIFLKSLKPKLCSSCRAYTPCTTPPFSSATPGP